ncbi:MAG TPA: homoserine dehydrogenase, partial [Gammaproteobacteria bacterium]|nr:homoserine dehydrogenase [Gammaproteobacteria bacterium]
KHLGIARQRQSGLEARVHCALVANDSLLSHVDGVANAVALSADAAGDMLLSGPGAGAEATASAA